MGPDSQYSTPRTAVRDLRRKHVSLLVALATAAISLPNAVSETVTRVIGWGDNMNGQLAIPVNLSGLTAISAGESHALALKNDGTVVAWGDNLSGQATPPKGLKNVESIAAGGFHSLALRRDGTVVAWGLNSKGQCTIPSNLGRIKAIAAGYAHSLALKSDGTVVAWGSNVAGQSDVPSNLSQIVAVYASGNWSGALKPTGFINNWGDPKDEPLVPTELGIGDRIASNKEHGIVLKSNGLLSGFGRNSKCQTIIPEGIRRAIAVAVGNGFSLAILELEKQEIDFKPLISLIYKKTPVSLSAESSSKLPVKFVSLNPAIAEVSEGKLILHTSGNLTINAVQEGNNQYAPALATQLVKVFPVPRKMTTFEPIGTVYLGMNPRGIELKATISEGNDPIIYSSSNPQVVRVESNRLYILSTGLAKITALARETPQYGYADPIKQMVEVKLPSTDDLIKTLFANHSLAGKANYKIGGHGVSDIDYKFATAFNGEIFGKGILSEGAEPKEATSDSNAPTAEIRRNKYDIRVSGTVEGPIEFDVNNEGAITTANAFLSLQFSKGLSSNGTISFNGGTISAEGPIKNLSTGFSPIGSTSARPVSPPVSTYSGLNSVPQKTQLQPQPK